MKIHNLNIKISACVIVKNEAENLPLWLEKMSQLADENDCGGYRLRG